MNQNPSVFPMGSELPETFSKYFIGQAYLHPLTDKGGPISNVTFSPGCRNNWHIHHKGGQILLVTGGKGWYQAWGQPAQELHPGDVVNIPPEVKHWHGAAADSWFSHLAVPREIDAEGNDVTPNKETFLRKGSGKCPNPAEGDKVTDQIQKVGLVSNRILTAEEAAKYKKDHWHIENCLHHVLDEDFQEDKSTARKSKNVLSVLRKAAYNIIRLMQMDPPEDRELVIDVIDKIADDFLVVAKWIFDPIRSFY